MLPEYAKATSLNAIIGGGSFRTSSKLKCSGLASVTFSMNPAASILSMIFCFDLACLTRLAYVPAEAMKLPSSAEPGTKGREPRTP